MACELPAEYKAQVGQDVIVIDGCGCAVIGVKEGHLVYDLGKLMKHFMEHGSNMSEFEAIEWIDFNIIKGLHLARGSNPPFIEEEKCTMQEE